MRAIDSANLRSEFWAEPLPLPQGVSFLRKDALVVPQRGHGGQAVYDLCELAVPHTRVPVLLAYKAPLFPADVVQLRERLRRVADEVYRRESAVRAPAPRLLPMIATDAASPGALRACE